MAGHPWEILDMLDRTKVSYFFVFGALYADNNNFQKVYFARNEHYLLKKKIPFHFQISFIAKVKYRVRH